jgi:hypothetical protein
MTDVEFVAPVLGSWNHIIQMRSISYVRSWEECGLNAGMAFWAAFDPKPTYQRAHSERFAAAAIMEVAGKS